MNTVRSTFIQVKVFDLETESKFINKNLTTLGRIFTILSNVHILRDDEVFLTNIAMKWPNDTFISVLIKVLSN